MRLSPPSLSVAALAAALAPALGGTLSLAGSLAGSVILTPTPLMADQMTEDAALFEIPLTTSDLPVRWRLDHGPLPAKAQITLQYDDGSAFSGVQFFGQRGAIPPAAIRSLPNHRRSLSAIEYGCAPLSGRLPPACGPPPPGRSPCWNRCPPVKWHPHPGLRSAAPR